MSTLFLGNSLRGSWIESIRKLDGWVEQINGHPDIDLTAKPAPTRYQTGLKIRVSAALNPAFGCAQPGVRLRSTDRMLKVGVVSRAEMHLTVHFVHLLTR
ncbi:MAG: hypothetical protein HC827_08480 [Cyanobacteria bacterium RM1_2_2]|nr:hypothetical protein [Cyanobacteria bacterium RM1_2_2]